MKTDTTEIQDGETRFNHIGKGANTAFHIIFILLSILCLAPLVFVIIISFSSEHSVMVNGYSFRPDEWSTGAYEFVFQSGGQVMHSLGMSALVTVTGVAIGMALTSTYAYVLSRKTFRYRKLFTGILVATMFFNGGLVSTYMVVANFLHLKNNFLALVLPVAVGLLPLFLLRWRMNLLTVGEEEAQSMGVRTGVLRLVVILCATLLTTASVAVSGMIGWVGLVIPHFCRMLFGYDYRRLIPAAALFGAAFLLAVDDIARLVTTGELPLGILTAFVGAPLFLYLIITGGRRHEH